MMEEAESSNDIYSLEFDLSNVPAEREEEKKGRLLLQWIQAGRELRKIFRSGGEEAG